MPRGEGGDPGGQKQVVDLILGIQGVERVAGEQEAGVGREGKEGIEGGHIVVEEEDHLSSRVIDLGQCTTKRLGWRVVGRCSQAGQRWNRTDIESTKGRTRLCKQTSHCSHSSSAMVTGEVTAGRLWGDEEGRSREEVAFLDQDLHLGIQTPGDAGKRRRA